MSDFSQISCDNCIIIFRLPVKVGQILCNKFCRCRCHDSSHVHGIFDAIINDLSGRDTGDFCKYFICVIILLLFCRCQNKSARSGNCPCCRNRALVRIFEWETKLLFRACKMTRSNRRHMIRIPGSNRHGGQCKCFSTGRACTIQTK